MTAPEGVSFIQLEHVYGVGPTRGLYDTWMGEVKPAVLDVASRLKTEPVGDPIDPKHIVAFEGEFAAIAAEKFHEADFRASFHDLSQSALTEQLTNRQLLEFDEPVAMSIQRLGRQLDTSTKALRDDDPLALARELRARIQKKIETTQPHVDVLEQARWVEEQRRLMGVCQVIDKIENINSKPVVSAEEPAS